MVEAWTQELQRIMGTHPCILAKLARPRVIVLPAWAPGRVNAWVYLNLIVVGSGLSQAPLPVIRYVLGHEYGHIYRAHTALQFAYWTALLTLVSAALADVPALVSATLVGLVGLSASTMNRKVSIERELEADAVAANIYGAADALYGAVWMAKACRCMQKAERQRRLKALGWVDARRKPGSRRVEARRPHPDRRRH